MVKTTKFWNPMAAVPVWRNQPSQVLDGSLRRVFMFLVLAFLSTATVTAQNGNVAYPENSIDSRIRTSMHVDPTSGAFQFQITLGNYPGRAGAGVPIVLNYSSKLWRLEHVSTFGGCDQWGYCYPQVSDYNAYFAESSAAGWTSNLDWFIWPSGESPIQTYDNLGRPADNMGQWQAARMYVRLPDGSKHELRRDDNVWSGYQTSGVYYAVDGSRLRYHTDTQTLWLPDGSRYVGNTQYIDRNGNILTYNGASWTDTLGRTIGLPLPAFSTTGEQSQASARDEYYSLTGVAGASLTYTFKWRRLADVRTNPGEALRPKGDRVINSCLRVSSLFTSPGICGTDEDHRIISSAAFNPVVLHQIVFPNGSTYTFTYNIYGEIDKVDYPTGGYEKFTHGQAPELSANFNSEQIGTFYAQGNRGVYEQRISADGTLGSEVSWQYTLGPVNWTTAADGTRTERRVHQSQGQLIAYGFDDPRAGLTYDERVLAPNNGPMLRRKLTDWLVDGTVQYWGPLIMHKTRNPRPVKEVEIILDTGGNALAATTTYQYDADLNVIATNRYAFVEVDQTTAQTAAISAIPTGSLVRTEETDYLTNNQVYRDRNMLSLPTATRVKNAAGTTISQSQTLYDEASYPLLPCGAATGWSDPATAVRGNATTSKSWLNTTGAWIEAHAQFDQCGSGRKSWDGKGNVTEVQYSGAYQSAYPTTSISAVPDPTGQTGSSTALTTGTFYDFNTGLVTSSTDANNQTTSFAYSDVLSRLTTVTRPAGGGSTTYSYGDAVGNIHLRVQTSLDATRVMESYKYFDGLGRPHRTYLNEGDGNYLATDTQYDNMGRAWRSSNPYRTATLNGAVNPSGAWATTAYDPLGRVTSVTTPDNASVKTAYSGNRVLVADQNTSDDLRRKRISETDALGRLKTVWEVTAADQYTEDVSFPNWPSVTKGYKTTYQYDTLDNLAQVSQGGQPARTFVYDSLKRISSATNPESGTISYSYDNNENLLTKIDARGLVSTYVYDALNRNTRIDYSDSTLDIIRQYDQAINGKARLSASIQGGSTTTATYIDEYDVLGRPRIQRQRLETAGVWSASYQTSRTYNLGGGVTSQTYPSGRTVSYTNDNAGRTNSFSGNLGGTNRSYASGISYSAFGGLRQEQFGTSTPVYHNLAYNVRGQAYYIGVGALNDGWSGDYGKLIYYYGSAMTFGGSGSDNNGNISLIDNHIPNGPIIHDHFDYDALNRLDHVFEETTTASFHQKYDYDRFGNRTINASQTWGAGINNKQFTVDSANNRLGVPSGQSGAMSYDAAGNLINDTYTGAGSRSYDAENRMTSAGSAGASPAVYTYNADGQRVRRMVNDAETWQVYGLDGELLAEYAQNGSPSSPQKEYGYRNGELLITAEPGNGGASAQAVNWTSASGVSVSGNTITKTAGNGWGNAGAVSTQSIASGNGYVEFTAAQSLVDRICGLSNGDSNQSYEDIDFGVFLSDGGYIYVYESGVLKANAGPYAVSDILRVAVEAGQVKYFKNGAVFYTSTATPAYPPLIVDTAIYSNGASISNVTISGVSAVNVALATNGATASASSIYWSQSPAANAINGDHVGTNGWWADGTSFGYPDWIQVDFAGSKTINEIDVFGLQQNWSSPIEPTLTMTSSYALTDFEVQYWNGSGWATVPGGTLTGNDKVWKKFTFEALTTSKIRVHITNVAGDNHSQVVEIKAWTAADGGGSSANINWLVTDHLGTPRMVIDQTGALANVKRHDYLPFGEELFAGQGGRTLALGYSGDNVRQKFTQKERDSETGLDYFLARYYSSTQGRFTSPDEFSGGPDELYDFAEDASENPTFYADIANPLSLNKYQYTYNNPTNLYDDDGHCLPFCAAAAAGAAVVLILISADTTHAPTGNETEPLARSGDGVSALVTNAAIGVVAGPILSKIPTPIRLSATRIGSKIAVKSGERSVGAEVSARIGRGARASKTGGTTNPGSKVKGLENTLSVHKQRLEAYKANPMARDNKGFLKNASAERRAKIIASRIRKLEGQIKNFENQIKKRRGGE